MDLNEQRELAVELLLAGTQELAELRGDFFEYSDGKPVAACAMGVLAWMLDKPVEQVSVEFNELRLAYFNHYGAAIESDNDHYGRDEVLYRLKDLPLD